MDPLLRFYRFHLRPHLFSGLAGAALFALANALQALILASLNLLFDVTLEMGKGRSATPAALRWVMDVLPSAESVRGSVFLLPGLVACLFVVRAVLLYTAGLLVARAGLRAVRELRERLFERLLVQDPLFFQQHPVGELMNRVLGDVAMVQNIASTQAAEVLKQSTLAVIMLVFIFRTDWQLGLALFVVVPVVFLPVRFLSRSIRRHGHRAQGGLDVLLQRLKEVLSNMRVVAAFGREDYEAGRFRDQGQALYRFGLRIVRIQSVSGPLMEIVGGLLLAAMAVFGAWRVQSGAMTGGAVMVLMLAILQLYSPIRNLTSIYADAQITKAVLERIFEILDHRPSIVAPADPDPVPERPARLAFEGVRFSYGHHEVLRGVDLVVERGETVALVGGSGGGKTTLVNLVPRFFDPTAGRVTLDGIDIRRFDPRALRRRIGVVTQETLLFMDSVHDNIAYGTRASREAVVEAATRAHAHEFIARLPQGYDTRLAETGASLSGGQRQRIAIARALLLDPPILILDEATSALDSESERAVQAALEELMKNRTTLVIAHRLSTIQRASTICALVAGRIVESGRHDELLARGGEYARLHALQFGDRPAPPGATFDREVPCPVA